MSFGILLILAIPSAFLYFRFENAHQEVVMQGFLVLALLFLGWLVLKIGGCILRLLGLLLILGALAAYYFLIIQPFFTGQIITFGFLR